MGLLLLWTMDYDPITDYGRRLRLAAPLQQQPTKRYHAIKKIEKRAEEKKKSFLDLAKIFRGGDVLVLSTKELQEASTLS